MTCKDCLHFEACGGMFEFIGLVGKGILDNADKLCNCFKDKSRFVELPCKIGDVVYVVENPYTFVPLKKPLEGYVMSIHKHEHGLFLRVLFDTKKINGTADYNLDWRLGETIFLTREAAEEALKEK